MKRRKNSRKQLYKVWDQILENGLVRETRRIAATVLYQANMDSPVMKDLERLSMTVADEKNKKILQEESVEIEPRVQEVLREKGWLAACCESSVKEQKEKEVKTHSFSMTSLPLTILTINSSPTLNGKSSSLAT